MTTATTHVELPADDLAGLDYREYIGTLALSLAAWGPYPGVCWEELAHAAPCLAEDRKWAAVGFINRILDDMAEGHG